MYFVNYVFDYSFMAIIEIKSFSNKNTNPFNFNTRYFNTTEKLRLFFACLSNSVSQALKRKPKEFDQDKRPDPSLVS